MELAREGVSGIPASKNSSMYSLVSGWSIVASIVTAFILSEDGKLIRNAGLSGDPESSSTELVGFLTGFDAVEAVQELLAEIGLSTNIHQTILELLQREFF